MFCKNKLTLFHKSSQQVNIVLSIDDIRTLVNVLIIDFN